MLLKDHFTQSGTRLFRWRGLLPLVFVPFLILAVLQGEQIEAQFGETLDDIYEILAIGLVFGGELIRILTVGFVPRGTSGRNTAGQVATVLNTTGAYSLVRNPLYLGNCIMYLGIAFFSQSLVLAAIMALALAIYYERIIAAEEDFLLRKFGTDYSDWAARTPAFFPKFTGWVPPEMGFSWKSVIRREHPSMFGAVAMLFLLEVGLHYLGHTVEPMQRSWFYVMGAACVLEIVALWAKKRTSLLNDPGR